MKILGLIVEYNPFHNGHLYHMEESLRITGADKAIVVMSGNFVQRGAPAIMPKHLRTEMALSSGASMVLELPVRYATGSAEFFAMGAVSLLHELGCVDCICFGSESGNIANLATIADILVNEPTQYQSLLQEQLKSGVSFPTARQHAMESYLHGKGYSKDISDLLSEPNNILGIEYIKALRTLNSSIRAFTIPRRTSHYHDTTLQKNFSSASAIRAQLNSLSDQELIEQVPESCYAIMKENINVRYPICSNDFSLLLHQKLLLSSLLEFQDMTPELANRILNLRNEFIDFDQFCQLINTRNMTHSRISRVLIHVLLGIKAYKMAPDSTNHYAHVLGFIKSDAILMNIIKERSSLPILTKLTRQENISKEGLQLLEEDIFAANLYETVVTHKYKQGFIHEYEQSIVIRQ